MVLFLVAMWCAVCNFLSLPYCILLWKVLMKRSVDYCTIFSYYVIFLLRGALKHWGVSWSTGGYLEVLRGTLKYGEVLWSTERYLEVLRGTLKHWGVPWSTEGYLEVLRGTLKYSTEGYCLPATGHCALLRVLLYMLSRHYMASLDAAVDYCTIFSSHGM